MKNEEQRILKRLKLYRFYNKIIPKFIKEKLNLLLIDLKVPPHTIGVFFNPCTSPLEQYEIIKYFMYKHDKHVSDILKHLIKS